MLSWGVHGPEKPCTYVQTKAKSVCMQVGCAACTATFTSVDYDSLHRGSLQSWWALQLDSTAAARGLAPAVKAARQGHQGAGLGHLDRAPG